MPERGSRGGPAACEPPFIAELRRLGHEVEEDVYAYSETKSALPNRIARVLRTGQRFQERVAAGNFDLVHINTSFDTRALLRDSAIVPRLHGGKMKIFLKFHGSDADLLRTNNPALVLARRRLLSHADGLGVLSSEEQENFLRAGSPGEKLFVIKNVVENNSQQPRREFRNQMNLAEDVPLLLFIGRFIPAKGLLDVIQACGFLRDRGHRFLLLAIGDGRSRVEAENEVARLRLNDHVRFFGYIPEEETAAFYANSTMLLFPTYHYEGFPMVIFNAAAAGLPVITTRIRAAADYLKEPDNCLWVKARDPEELAARVKDVLEDPELRMAMHTKNKTLASEFSAVAVTQEYIKAFGEIVK
ncbi:MAG: glycosyltransferase family 4 protein [Acidobacteriota bacterium]|nr:glycosyltransferase family 4 protein [Acidobacteriota bacterium]